ncbi:hypothetical protein [Candidatus Mesenet endosymbiont of Agriotes lineatus]|uniref:hypothetical protein n=1 Tax=Candidatus Mesenet endosymbiont of Agriotes lineatus TaxID=3077948 RepID=UPI0030CE413F
MNDKKIRDEYRNKYHDFVSKEIVPIANKTLLDDKQIELSAYNNAGSVIGINSVLVSFKQHYGHRNEGGGTTYISKTIEYTSDERYYRAFGNLVDDSMNRIKVGNQNSFFDFIAVCINGDVYDHKIFATKEELFNHLRGLIDDKRYINQRRAAFEPSKFPEMSVWRQSEYYDFVDSRFKKKLCEIESIGGIPVANTIAITDINLKQQFVRFRVEGDTKPYVYTSNSKYHKSITSEPKYGRVLDKEEVNAFKIENNDPNFMFILRCLNKDKKALEPVLQYRQPVKYKEFTQRELSAYLDGFISDDKYKNEYDITFVPVEVNPGVDESLKEKYIDFVEKEIKPKIKNMWMVSADDDSIFFAQHYGTLTVMGSKVDNTPEHDGADVVLTPHSRLNSYRKKGGQEVYGIPNDNPNFKFIRECLSHNGTESKWIQFVPTREEYLSGNNKDLLQRLEKLPFNQQCKEDYLNNFISLPGSSSSAVSTMLPPVMHQAVFFTWLAYILSPVINPVFNYISNKIIGPNHIDDREKKKELSDKPSSNMTEAREQQLDKKGIMK